MEKYNLCFKRYKAVIYAVAVLVGLLLVIWSSPVSANASSSENGGALAATSTDTARLSGLKTVGGHRYYYVDGVRLKNALKRVGNTYYYFGSTGAAITSRWYTINKVDYYFSSNGKAVCRFFKKNYSNKNYAGKLYKYIDGKWKRCGAGVKNIGGSYYYFEDGRLTTKSRWYVQSSKCRYYISGGAVRYKLSRYGTKRYICYVLSGGKWRIAKSVWLPVYDHTMIHINSAGISDKLYYSRAYGNSALAGTYQVFSGSKWQAKKNTVAYISGAYYYFNSKGKVDTSKGWKTISPVCAAYVSSYGYVTGYVGYNYAKGSTTYKTGKGLKSTSAGLKKVVINKTVTYFYSNSNGVCRRNTKVKVGQETYAFDRYGRCVKNDGINWDYDEWMKRVVNTYLGESGIWCNEFAAWAFGYAGGNNPYIDKTVKYDGSESSGLYISSTNTCIPWGEGEVVAKAVTSDGKDWQSERSYVVTKDREDFSYEALVPGDVIVYYDNSGPAHMAIYIGQYETKDDVKSYLRSLGVPDDICDEYVRGWGSIYNNRTDYWVIQGGMGSAREVYISNSAENMGDVARKIIHVKH